MKHLLKIFVMLAAIAAALTACNDSTNPDDLPALGWDYMEIGPAEQTVTNTVYCDFDYAEVVWSWEGLARLDPVFVTADREGKCFFGTASYTKPQMSVTFTENISTRKREAVATLYKGEEQVAEFKVVQNGKEDQQ